MLCNCGDFLKLLLIIINYVALLQYSSPCRQLRSHISTNILLPKECITCSLLHLSFLVTYSPSLLTLHSLPLQTSNGQISLFPLLSPEKCREVPALGAPAPDALDSLPHTFCPKVEASSLSTHLCLKKPKQNLQDWKN